jgi:predicted ArsR family transcriptional regulator
LAVNQNTALFDPDMQKLQALAMVQKRLEGMSLDEVAAHFKVCRATVDRRLLMLRKERLIEKAAAEMVTLLSDAARVYRETMTQTDDKKLALDAARDIAYGTGALTKQNKTQTAPPGGEMTLRAWREKRFATNTTDNGPEPAANQGHVEETRILELTGTIPTPSLETYLESLGEDDLLIVEESADSDEIE